jgi:hypothetical protein
MEDPSPENIVPTQQKQPSSMNNRVIVFAIAALLASVCVIAFIITRNSQILEWPALTYIIYGTVDYVLGRHERR